MSYSIHYKGELLSLDVEFYNIVMIEMFSVVNQSYISNPSQTVSKIQPMKLHYEKTNQIGL